MLVRTRGGDTAGADLAEMRDELKAISLRCAALPDHDRRRPEEIIGFDERGVPC